MTCDELDDLIEAYAAGELPASAGVDAHLAGCARCRSSLAIARAVHETLAAHTPAEPRDGFVPAVLARVRRERWRSEQLLDLAFNVVVGLAVTVGIGGLLLLLSVSGLAAVSADMVRLFLNSTTTLATRITPMLPVYGLAVAVFASAIAVWWWAERGFEV